MAIISKIRSYSGLLIAIIGFGLAAFVLGDLFQYGPRQGSGRQDMKLAEIGSTTITYPEFDQRFNQQLENWKEQTGVTSPDRQQLFRIRQQVWDQMVEEVIMEEELGKIGIDVSSDELFELVAGEDPHPFIVQSFTDPQTGEFHAEQVRDFIQNIHRMEPQMRNQWLMIEQHIKNERKEEKFQNLVKKSFSVPDIFAELEHQTKNEYVDIQFIGKDYNDISDDEITLSEDDIQKAYNENKNRFKQEHTRDLEYVAVPVHPTEEDIEDAKNEIQELKEELQEVEGVERFVNSVSDDPMDEQYYSKDNLPGEIDSVMFSSPEGTIYGPYEKDNAFAVAKLNDIQFRPDSMQASHILISHRRTASAQQQQVQRPQSQAREKADSLLSVARENPAHFPQLAMEFSDDPSAAMNQGDLGWFKDGDMVPEFNEAVASGNVGDIVKVESDFGFHIIHITDHSPTSKKVQVAEIVREIRPSSSTYRAVFREVSEFADMVRTEDNFENAAREKGYSTREATHIGKMDNSLPGVERAREIVRWAYDEETKVGATSQIFDLDEALVFARLAKIREEGTPPLEDIRSEIERIARENKKFEIIAEEMQQAIMEHESLDRVAEILDLEVNSANNINFSTTNLPDFGREPKVIGHAIGLNENQISQPVKGNNAAFLINVVNKTVTEEPAELTATIEELQNNFGNKVANETIRALKENADITDNRPRFY